MSAQNYPCLSRRSQEGVTLIEALVALMVMSFGMVALVGLLSNLRSSGDIAKQRSEAMRLAQAELGTLRSFSVLTENSVPSIHDYDNDIVTPQAFPSRSGENDNTTFVIGRKVTPLVNGSTEPQARTVSVNVSWTDRAGTANSATLHTIISRTDPLFSSALSITPPANGVRLSGGRNPAIPASAKDLGNGSSAFLPSGSGRIVWVFNNVTGVIIGKCEIEAVKLAESLNLSDVESCNKNKVYYLVSGTIRFSNTSPANPSIPEATAQASASVYLSLAASQFTVVGPDGKDALAPGGAYPDLPKSECFNDAPITTEATRTFINYSCIVIPNTQTTPNWWGQVLVGGLDLGTRATQFRVCRYSADYNGNGRIDNEEHPASYSGVSYSLARQNFLVVRGDVSCPTATAVDPTNGVFVDYSTTQIQPS